MARALESKRAKGRKCPSCRRVVLQGLDEGLLARVDLAPVDHDGEIKALLTGRWTYSLMPGRWLVHRNQDRIADLDGSVHVEHRCVMKG